MFGRGRGRGRGKCNQMSFEYNQLGFGRGEALPTPALYPPPTFPILEHEPLPLKSGLQTEYMVALKRDFVEYFHTLRQINSTVSAIERFSDKYQIMSSDAKEPWDCQIYWDALPAELNPKKKVVKRKGGKLSPCDIKKSKIDLSNRLDKLAKLEGKEEEDLEDAKEAEEKDGNDDNDKENFEGDEDEDEEMDDGTDYLNNYFDNGESYFDDDNDNLDDGLIY